jgi:hypothetical protein
MDTWFKTPRERSCYRAYHALIHTYVTEQDLTRKETVMTLWWFLPELLAQYGRIGIPVEDVMAELAACLKEAMQRRGQQPDTLTHLPWPDEDCCADEAESWEQAPAQLSPNTVQLHDAFQTFLNEAGAQEGMTLPEAFRVMVSLTADVLAQLLFVDMEMSREEAEELLDTRLLPVCAQALERLLTGSS